jgi:hypothetical protein
MSGRSLLFNGSGQVVKESEWLPLNGSLGIAEKKQQWWSSFLLLQQEQRMRSARTHAHEHTIDYKGQLKQVFSAYTAYTAAKEGESSGYGQWTDAGEDFVGGDKLRFNLTWSQVFNDLTNICHI